MIQSLQGVLFILLVFMGTPAFGDLIPRPLKDIKIDVAISSHESGKGLSYTYDYSIYNPASNDGRIDAIGIFLEVNQVEDKELAMEWCPDCQFYQNTTSGSYMKWDFPVPVAAVAPNNWRCGYREPTEAHQVLYSCGVYAESEVIKPGQSKGGFQLISEGLPGIREAQVEPSVRLSFGPDGMEEPDMSIFRKVMWKGKTVGPKAPPKVFDPTKFIQYIESLLKESSKLGWIKGPGVESGLYKKLREIEKKIGSKEKGSARRLMENFLKEVKKLKGKKGFRPEAHALLYYNGLYFLNHLKTTDKGR